MAITTTQRHVDAKQNIRRRWRDCSRADCAAPLPNKQHNNRVHSHPKKDILSQVLSVACHLEVIVTKRQITVNKTDTFHTLAENTEADIARFGCAFKLSGLYITLPVGGRSLFYLAPKLWNNLSNTVREAGTLCQFKSRLKTHLFNLAYT